MKSPLLMTVVPSFLYSVPLLMPVILKWVTSAPSTALRLNTSPLLVCTPGEVLALLTLGVSATGVTVMVAVAVAPPRPPSLPAVAACAANEPALSLSAVGVNFRPAWPSA
jgi:hypothetical protein